VGGVREEPVDCRVIAATNRDLDRMVADGSFREDLYYRLHVVEVRLPPLRERADDIPMLIDHFLQIFATRYRRDRKTISREALRFLCTCPWPGNVRQLENTLLNAWVMSDQPELALEDFELAGLRPDPSSRVVSTIRGVEEPPPSATQGSSSRRGVETSLSAHQATEKERILAALSACNWNRVKAAAIVGIPRRTFYRRLAKYGIQ
jgi:DNA-binding NtrC family response regulator